MRFLNHISQAFPPKPRFTEKDLPDLRGKIYIVTGSNTGVGKELAQILYSRHAKVYVACRSQEKALKAIKAIKEAAPNSRGELVFLSLDLADLTKIKASAEEFLSKETKLHVLFNNAGVLWPPQGSKTPQGYELQLGTNNVGTFMFTKLLTPILVATAKNEPPSVVRVVWVASNATELGSPTPGGLFMDNLDYHNDKSAMDKYAISKVGNYYHAAEFAKRHEADGVVSVSLNPGMLDSDLYRHSSAIFAFFLRRIVLHPPIFGAYTELFAGMSPEVTIERSGDWIVPWGRFMDIRKDLLEGSKTVAEGGTGLAQKFWAWNDEQVKPYL